jgi:putative ABC transport system permease protein
MIRHILIAAWRNLAANRLTSAIAILGLAVGIAAALLMALVVRNQMRFDDVLPLHERTYLAASSGDARLNMQESVTSDYRTAATMWRNIPGIESITRLALIDENYFGGGQVRLKQGNVAAWETIYWADPNAFDVLRLPVLHGDLATALRRPDGIVLPRAVARKYFGRDDVVGQTILVKGHPMIVRAVIRDLPANGTGLATGIFASGLASFSDLPDGNVPLEELERRTQRGGTRNLDAVTYLRLKPGVSAAEVQRKAHSLITFDKNSVYLAPVLLRLDKVNLAEGLNPGIRSRLAIMIVSGFLILLIAAINFVNLAVARGSRRGREVGIKKACGAGRGSLVVQYLGEALLATLLAAGIAMALCEWLLPPLNAFLQSGATSDYWNNPELSVLLLLGSVLLGLAAGAYPAFVLASFRPANALRGGAAGNARGDMVRNVLVTFQFATLVVLAVAAIIVWQQRSYATGAALRADIDQVLLVKNQGGTCPPSFESEVRKLPSVMGAACSGEGILRDHNGQLVLDITAKGQTGLFMVNTDPGLFALYGIKPVAGSLRAMSPTGKAAAGFGVVINMAAVRKLGFASPQAAIGQSWIPHGVRPNFVARNGGSRGIIMAVVPDFAFYSVSQSVEPHIYTSWSGWFGRSLLHIKLSGHRMPETLAAISHIWTVTNQPGPFGSVFMDAHMQQLYLDMTRQAQAFGAFAALAIVLACLGLVGIAVSTAERRTKEIGIRKAMGAGNAQIVALLLWQFAQPVLWANVIAWPLAWWLMRRWLSGFAYHVALHWWVFVAASLGALLIALATVAGQAWLTARAKPVLALRYE